MFRLEQSNETFNQFIEESRKQLKFMPQPAKKLQEALGSVMEKIKDRG